MKIGTPSIIRLYIFLLTSLLFILDGSKIKMSVQPMHIEHNQCLHVSIIKESYNECSEQSTTKA